MNDWLVLIGLVVLATLMAGPVIVSDWRREARNKKKPREF
jgi:hypothetical protein